MVRKLLLKLVQSERTAVPYLVLLGALLLTAIVTAYMDSLARARDKLRFDNAIGLVQYEIQDHLKTYIALLQAGSGLFVASEQVNRNEFQTYASQLKLREQYPGIQGIGFSIRIPSAQKETLIADMRRQGVQTFDIRPDFERNEYHAILYLEPLDRRNQAAIGFDMFTEPVRRAAMERARDTGVPAASGRVTLLQEIDSQKQAGFLIYLPFYTGGSIPETVAERRVRLQGFVYSPFRADDFIQGIFGNNQNSYVDFQVYDGTEIRPSRLLYRSDRKWDEVNASNSPHFTAIATLDIAGRPWTLVFNSTLELEQNSERRLILLVALVGGLFSFVLFGVTRSQVQARMAAERTAAELRQSEQALQGANQQIGTILESITDAFVAFDREWHYTYVNDAAEQLLHRTREDLLGKHIWDEVFPQAKGEIFYRELHRAVAEQVSIALEAFSKTLNCWLEIHAYPSTEGLAVYFRDVTNFRQAEKERERFFTLSMDMLCTANFDGYFTRINPAFERILGYTSAELLSKPFFELVHPEDLEKTIAELQKLATGQPTLYFENRYCCQDGSYKWLAWTSSPVIEEELTYAVARDITEQRQAEEFLRQTNERLKLLSETASDLLLNEQPQEFINSLFQKLSVHLGLEVYFNYLVNPEQQLLQLHAYSGIPEALAKEIEWVEIGHWMCGWVAQHQQPLVRENVLQSTDDVTALLRAARITAYACYPLIAQEQLIGTLSFGTRNRSGFKSDELELMQVVCNQVATALERARLIAQLQQQTEELIGANRRKDEFLAILSHELRSPLNPILGWVKLLRSHKLDRAASDRALETIERNAELQAQLIEDLLDVSRILSGKLSLNAAPVDLVSIIKAALETVRLAAEAKSIPIQTLLEPNLGKVLGDSGRLQQVVWNLLSNAIKFTPQGGRVEVRLEQVKANAQIRVSDTGKGIDPAFLPYVFDSFRQADSTTTRMFGGLGLGLAIVRQLVELHGGTVHAASPGEDKGATFLVQLPLITGESEKKDEKETPLFFASFPSPLSDLRILVVDDEVDMRELLSFVLEQNGAEVTIAASAREALHALTQSKPDLLLSDIGLPEIDGYRLMQQIRNLEPEQGGQIPAIALTAYAGEYNQQQALTAGFQQHLAKPIEPAKLVMAIVTLMGRSHRI